MSKKSQLCFCFFLMLKRVRFPTRRISWCDTCFASMYLSFFWNRSLRIEFGYAISAYSAHTTGRDVTETTWSVDCMPDATWHPGSSTFSLWFTRVTAMVLLCFWSTEICVTLCFWITEFRLDANESISKNFHCYPDSTQYLQNI